MKKTYIALLRGINVGGHRQIPMAALREFLTKSGFQNVETYIQSGNVVFQSSEVNALKIEATIQKAIFSHFGFEVSVLIKTREDLQHIFDASPFVADEKKASYFMMLHDTPEDTLVKEASEKVYEDEVYHIINDCLYFYCEKGYGKAKFNMNYFERKLKTFATSRNYKTMIKLLEMSTT